ncbi:MAG: undecaprenyl-diphosphate phosphatase [Pseudomonadales bacterium]
MDWLQIITLALVQGITEFLPISSSAHLILVAKFGSWGDQGLAFDVAVHLGTLTAVCLYLRQDLGRYLTSGVRFAAGRGADADLQEMLKVGLATLPVVVGGVLLQEDVEGRLRATTVIATTTIVFGLVLAVADRFRGTRETVTWTQAGLIGLAQALALVPGTSRSGITITAALFLGLTRQSAARFSFLLSIPTIAGAALLMLVELIAAPEPALWGDLLMGAVLAGVSAYLCISAFIALVERTGMLPYVIYRIALGIVLFLAGAVY